MPAYRPDIEGLRCIAVLAVLVFHLDPAVLPGGFQGVDIFFVVSGFVITRLILASGEYFSFRTFYIRRFWRLFPALCATVAATLVAAYLFFSTAEFITLGWSAAASIFGISNFYFYGQLDYLNDNTLFRPLLHTWSLGVEEQFYLLWPFVLVVLSRYIGLSWLVAATLAGSFALNIFMVEVDSQFAFYMAPVRFFEFAAGAAVYLWGRHVPRALTAPAGGVGLALIAAGLLQVGENHAWPDYVSLLPVGGTALLLIAGTHPIWRRILGNVPFQMIGRLSYSLYLVHWPIIVIYRYWRVVPISNLEIAYLAGASFVLALALHILVEIPYRTGGRPVWQGFLRFDIRNWAPWHRLRPVAISLGAGATLAFAFSVVATSGYPHRINRNIDKRPAGELTYAGDICEASRSSKCQFGDPEGKRTIYVVGDSHAGNLFFGLDRFFREFGIRGIGYFDHGCLFLYGTTRFVKGKIDDDCAENIADAFEVLGGLDAPVIMAGSLDGYIGSIGLAQDDAPLELDRKSYMVLFEQKLRESLTRLGADRRPVLLVKLSYSTGINTASCLSRPAGRPAERLKNECKPKNLAQNNKDAADIDGVVDRVSAQFSQTSVLDPKQAFCDDAGCTVLKDGAYLFRDASHLTNEGSVFLIERWREPLSTWLDAAFGDAHR